VKEPRRWLDDASAPEDARELLRHARATRPADRRALALSAALIAKIVATPSAAAAWPLAVKILVSASLLGTVGIGAKLAMPARLPPDAAPAAQSHPVRKRPSPDAAPRAVREPKALTFPAPPDAGSTSAVLPAPPVQSIPAVPSRASATTLRGAREQPLAAAATTSPSGQTASRIALARSEPEAKDAAAEDQLLHEVQLLDHARALLARDPTAALRTVAAHAGRFPKPLLAAERELIAVEALLRLGRDEEARTRAADFMRAFSGSIYRKRVRALLAGPP
jgi:hypothetical protein